MYIKWEYFLLLTIIVVSKSIGKIEPASSEELRKSELYWKTWKSDYPTFLKTRQYCMRWCPANITNWEKINLYPELPSYPEIGEYKGQYQSSAEAALGLKCCHICTVDCFKVIASSEEFEVFSDSEIVLVTTATMQRLSAFERLRQLWQGPIAVLFYLSDYNDIKLSENMKINGQLSTIIDMAKRWPKTLVMAYLAKLANDRQTLSHANTVLKNHEVIPFFPINTLRNVITDRVKAKYIFPSDVDFLPSQNLYNDLVNMLDSFKQMDKFGVIFPHWEVRNCAIKNNHIKSVMDYPQNFDDFFQYTLKGIMRPFHADMQYFKFSKQIIEFEPKLKGCGIPKQSGHIKGNPWGVRLSEYENWINRSSFGQREPNLIPLCVSCVSSRKSYLSWEPFFLISRVSSLGFLLRYNELFVARVLNKVQWVSGLREQGFKFYTLSRHFLLHKNHRPSSFSSLLAKQHPNHRSNLEKALWRTVSEIYSSMNPLNQTSEEIFLLEHESEQKLSKNEGNVEDEVEDTYLLDVPELNSSDSGKISIFVLLFIIGLIFYLQKTFGSHFELLIFKLGIGRRPQTYKFRKKIPDPRRRKRNFLADFRNKFR